MNDIVVFGASHLVDELDLSSISFIVDNNPDLQGTLHLGLSIKSPDILSIWNDVAGAEQTGHGNLVAADVSYG